MAETLVEMVESDESNEVVAVARHGHEAVDLAASRRPDLITMDVLLPGLNGLEATKAIMRKSPCPIVMITSQANNEELETAFKAFTAGALAILEKPQDVFSAQADLFQENLLAHIRYLGNHKIHQKLKGLFSPIQRSLPPGIPPSPAQIKYRAIGVSTGLGGPLCLTRLLLYLPTQIPQFLLVAQRMPRGFTTGFCRWLAQNTGFPVAMVRDPVVPQSGHVYFAADGGFLEVTDSGHVRMCQAATGNDERSGDHLFSSMAEGLGPSAIGVVMSGTGPDGAQGLKAIADAGGACLAQDDHTSLACEPSLRAQELGAVSQLTSLGQLGSDILSAAWRAR